MTNKRFFFILSLIHFYNNQYIDGKTMKLRHWSVNIWHIIKASMTTASVLRCYIGNSCLQIAKIIIFFPILTINITNKTLIMCLRHTCHINKPHTNKSGKNRNSKVLFKDHIHVQYKENNRSFNLLPSKFNNK